jgi:hypothetical protein
MCDAELDDSLQKNGGSTTTYIMPLALNLGDRLFFAGIFAKPLPYIVKALDELHERRPSESSSRSGYF